MEIMFGPQTNQHMHQTFPVANSKHGTTGNGSKFFALIDLGWCVLMWVYFAISWVSFISLDFDQFFAFWIFFWVLVSNRLHPSF